MWHSDVYALLGSVADETYGALDGLVKPISTSLPTSDAKLPRSLEATSPNQKTPETTGPWS